MFAEKAIMAADSQEDLPIKPQQIIGGINGNCTTSRCQLRILVQYQIKQKYQ